MQYGAVTDIRDLKEVPIGAEKCQGTGDDTMNSRKITCASFLFGGEHINKGKTHYGHAYASPSGGFSWFKRRIQGMSWDSDTIKNLQKCWINDSIAWYFGEKLLFLHKNIDV